MESDSERQGQESLRDIARWLTTPARAGVYLSASDLRRIGSGLQLSGIPVNRRFAIEQLFRSAALDDRVRELFDVLISEVATHQAMYRECDSSALDHWDQLACETIGHLRKMRAAVSSGS